jgi:propionyl-CoA synthetase
VWRHFLGDGDLESVGEYKEFHHKSLSHREAFWGAEASAISWETPFSSALDYSNPPFARWFVGGRTNICHNALDRHLASRRDQRALIYVSTETGATSEYTYGQLHSEVSAFAAALRELGVTRGARVIIYLPMIPEAAIAMLACVRIGAIHSVVFGGMGAASLAARIDDAQPTVLVTADAGSRGGKIIPYMHVVAEALDLAVKKPAAVVVVNRGLDPGFALKPGRDIDFEELRTRYRGTEVACEWLESSEPSYILYTSGTTGKPKGVQRDTGGYAVALASSMRRIFTLAPAETMFTTSDVGWVVGHSYIVYGPLINGSTTIMYEGLPVRPDPATWWRIVETYRVAVMFSSPTALRVLKRYDPKYLSRHDVSSVRYLFLAGEPLDEPTARWASDSLGIPIMDNYWQTESGWPILSAQPGIEDTARKFGSPSFPVYGYNVCLIDPVTNRDVDGAGRGVVGIEPPLPPGCLTTLWNDDARFVEAYFSTFDGRQTYSTFDLALRDEEGYYFLLGRTDDVINVAGHRIGTREIEEAIQAHKGIAEVAVVGVADPIKGQVPYAFVVAKDQAATATDGAQDQLRKEVLQVIEQHLGRIARPSAVHFVALLPKTRSGKILRRVIQAFCEGCDPGDLGTVDDMGALDRIRTLVASDNP